MSSYAQPSERPPLFSYAALMGLFAALFSGGLLAAKRSGRNLPERIGTADLLTVGVASHKLSRLI